MRAALVVALGLAAAGCGRSKRQICEQVATRALDCTQDDLTSLPPEAAADGRKFVEHLITELCADDDAATAMLGARTCLETPDCNAFTACMQTAAPGPLGGVPGYDRLPRLVP
jgi:hypothetical protein